MGLAYHPSAIREREYPPAEEMTNREKLSVGSRRFMRQSYGDMLPADKNWQVVFRVWPGTQRVLGLGRSGAGRGLRPQRELRRRRRHRVDGTDDVQGAAGHRHPGRTSRLSRSRAGDALRLGKAPAAIPAVRAAQLLARMRSPEVWRRYLRHRCGDAAEAVETAALAPASRILPLLTQTHGPSIANNNYWPEIYTNIAVIGDNRHRPYGDDMDAPIRFGTAPTFDPQMFANAHEYRGGPDRPARRRGAIRRWMLRTGSSAMPEEAEIAIAQAKSKADASRTTVRAAMADRCRDPRRARPLLRGEIPCRVLGRIVPRDASAGGADDAVCSSCRARDGWQTAARLSEDVYPQDISFGPGPHLRGNWQVRLAAVERELQDTLAFRFRPGEAPQFDATTGLAAIANLKARKPVREAASQAASPDGFTRGRLVPISLGDVSAGSEHVLHYRHVNQSERWQSVPMHLDDGRAAAQIPAAYTDTAYHLQFYISSVRGDEVWMNPGLSASLANVPYRLILQGSAVADRQGGD